MNEDHHPSSYTARTFTALHPIGAPSLTSGSSEIALASTLALALASKRRKIHSVPGSNQIVVLLANSQHRIHVSRAALEWGLSPRNNEDQDSLGVMAFPSLEMTPRPGGFSQVSLCMRKKEGLICGGR